MSSSTCSSHGAVVPHLPRLLPMSSSTCSSHGALLPFAFPCSSHGEIMRWGGGGEGDWSYLGEIERTAALARRGREGGVEEERRRRGDWGRSEREWDWGRRARAGIGGWRLGFYHGALRFYTTRGQEINGQDQIKSYRMVTML